MSITGAGAGNMANRAPVRSSQASSGNRVFALDQLRGFIIVLVVLHHSILAYCTFGHVDRVHYALSTAPIVDARSWVGFDIAVAVNDAFFMPLLFLLSGLFVRDGLVRRKPLRFLRRRLLRLGLPFAVAELTVIPLAYYPSFLQSGGAAGFPRFWMQTVTTGPWPSGPPWFIAILLLFDGAAALVFAVLRQAVPAVASRSTPGPARSFGLLLAGSALLYLPLLVAFGPARWMSVGPVAVQASRVLFYGVYFAAGVALGAIGTERVALFGQAVACRWGTWATLAILTSPALVTTRPLLAAAAGRLPPWIAMEVAGLALPTYCAAACFAWPALFLRFGGRPSLFWTSLTANSFTIYLLHYPVVTWMQYALLSVSASALVKGTSTFCVALFASWVGAVLLRRLPGAARVI